MQLLHGDNLTTGLPDFPLCFWGSLSLDEEGEVRVPPKGSPRDLNWGLCLRNQGRDPVPAWV